MRRTYLKSLMTTVSTAVLAAFSTTAFAQTAVTPSSTSAQADGGQLQEIVIVGEKRETKLQTAPLAITAITSATLEARNTQNLQDISSFVPGLNITNNQGPEYIISIRGIGYETDSNPNSFPGVAFHIDGVYIAHTDAVGQGLVDVDHIEVLRGPQGTVFGETATGGAINVILKKPQLGVTSGEASLSYGNYNYVKAGGVINLPLGGNVALRVAGQYLRHDGYGYNIGVPGIKRYPLDDANNLTGRASLLWQPSSDFEAMLNVEAYHTRTNGALQKLQFVDLIGVGGVSDTTPGDRVVDQDLASTFLLNTRMAYLSLRYIVSDTVVAKSVTAYQYMYHDQTSSSDRTALPSAKDSLDPWRDVSKTWSQEFSLSSQNTRSIDWTVGALYLRQRALQNIVETGTPNNSQGLIPGSTTNYFIFQTDSPYQHTSVGVYGQGIAHLSNALSLTAGARYNWDKVSAQPYQNYTVQTPRSTTSHAVTGKLSLDYKVRPNNIVYVTGSYGYKPAGVSFTSTLPFMPDSFVTGPQFVPAAFKKETVRALEIGSKNEFFNHTLRVNASGYYYWYHNYQYTAEDPVPFAGGSANIPRANLWGAEVEASWKATRQLTFDANFAYNRGEFKSHLPLVDPQEAAILRHRLYESLGFPPNFLYDGRIEAAVAASATDIYGRSVPKIPEKTGTFAATYRTQVGEGFATIRGEGTYRASYNYLLFDNAQFNRVPSQTLANLYISYEPIDKPWKISLTATNLFNKDAIASKFADPYGSFATSVQYVAPRQVFGTVGFKF